jgi:cytochrome c oxidase subunit 2
VGFGRLAGLIGGGGVLVVLLGGCTVDEVFSLGWPQGGITRQSQQMYDLWIGSVIAALTIGFFVWGLIFWCVVRYRKKGDALPSQTRYNMPLELLYSVLPFLIIAVLFYHTAVTETYVNKQSPNPDVTVDVVAFKWNWKFAYPQAQTADGQPVETIGSSNYVPVLVVPTGKTIRFVENSKDVIHSFWVPELLFKRDVIPGVVNSFEVTITQTGAYVGRCAELCGAYHSMMNFELRSVTPEKYETFIAVKKAGKSTPEALAAIGEAPLAVTTAPFTIKPETRLTS